MVLLKDQDYVSNCSSIIIDITTNFVHVAAVSQTYSRCWFNPILIFKNASFVTYLTLIYVSARQFNGLWGSLWDQEGSGHRGSF